MITPEGTGGNSPNERAWTPSGARANDPTGSLLVAKYGKRWRFTLNPPSRQQLNNGWDAGPVCDWCEVGSEMILEAARRAAGRVAAHSPTQRDQGQRGRSVEPVGPSRLDRQSVAHALGYCIRSDGHWPGAE